MRPALSIVFATEYYPPFSPGGSPWSIRLLAEALAAAGQRVSVVTPNWGAPEREESGGVSIARFPVGRRLPPGPAMAPVRVLTSPGFHFRFQRAIVAEGRRVAADVVHAQDKHALVGSYVAARRLRRPVFLTLRDTGLLCPIATCLLQHDHVPADCSAGKLQRECAPWFLDRYIPPGRARRARVRANLAVLYADARLKQRLIARLDGLVSVSRGLLEIYRRAGRGRREAAHVVYTLPPEPAAADPARLERLRARVALDGAKTVLYVGKLSPGKGGPELLRAASLVAATQPGAVFLVAGPEPPPAGAANVRWIGQVPHADLLALYQMVDLVVLPSVGPEALSRVPLEAAAAGRPTIGARAGGIPEEIVDGETGVLVDRGDADALARAVGDLLEDDGRRRALGEGARRLLATRFDRDAIVQSLLDVYATARGIRARPLRPR